MRDPTRTIGHPTRLLAPNITDDELEALKEIAEQLLARTGKQLDEAVRDGSLQEICHENQL